MPTRPTRLAALRSPRLTGALLLVFLALSPIGCLGNQFAGTAPIGSAGDGLGGSNNGGGDGAAAGAGGFVAASGARSESTGLKRLTRAEYQNSVVALFGTAGDVRDALIPDDVVNNFDNNAQSLTMDTARLQGFVTAAEAVADEVVGSPNKLRAAVAPCASNGNSRACLVAYVQSMGPKVWRRPLTADEQAALVTAASANSGETYDQQVRRATVLMLMSPYFLYRVELGGNDKTLTAYELATRLAYFLWRRPPDEALLAAAADGSLRQDDVLMAQVDRMMQDPRAATMASDFASQWLGLAGVQAYQPDATLFPAWDTDVRAAALAQTQATIVDLFGGNTRLSDVFDGNTTYVNDRLAKFYGMASPSSDTLVQVPAGNRRGLLTQAAVLAATSSSTSTSIILRGRYVVMRLQCGAMGAPPDNAGTLGDIEGAYVTQRQHVEAIQARPACAVCHNILNPYGYVLEPFDATGGARTTDNGQPIDPSATLPDGTKLANVTDLSRMLATDPRTASCFVQQLLTYALGRTLVAEDASEVNALVAKFKSADQRADALVGQIVLSPLFRQRNDGAAS